MSTYNFTSNNHEKNMDEVVSAIAETHSILLSIAILRVASKISFDKADYIKIPLTELCKPAIDTTTYGKKLTKLINTKRMLMVLSPFFKNDIFDIEFGETFTVEHQATDVDNPETYTISIDRYKNSFFARCTDPENIKILVSTRKSSNAAASLTNRNLINEVQNIIGYLLQKGTIILKEENDVSQSTEISVKEDDKAISESLNQQTTQDTNEETHDNDEEDTTMTMENNNEMNISNSMEDAENQTEELSSKAGRPEDFVDTPDNEVSEDDMNAAYAAFIKNFTNNIGHQCRTNGVFSNIGTLMFLIKAYKLCIDESNNNADAIVSHTFAEWIKLITDEFNLNIVYRNDATHTEVAELKLCAMHVILDEFMFTDIISTIHNSENIYNIPIINDDQQNQTISLSKEFYLYLASNLNELNSLYLAYQILLTEDDKYLSTLGKNKRDIQQITKAKIDLAKIMKSYDLKYKPLYDRMFSFISGELHGSTINNIDQFVYEDKVFSIFDMLKNVHNKTSGHFAATFCRNDKIEHTKSSIVNGNVKDILNGTKTTSLMQFILPSNDDKIDHQVEEQLWSYQKGDKSHNGSVDLSNGVCQFYEATTSLKQTCGDGIYSNEVVIYNMIISSLSVIQRMTCSLMKSYHLDERTNNQIIGMAINLLFTAILLVSGSISIESLIETDSMVNDMNLNTRVNARTAINVAILAKALVQTDDVSVFIPSTATAYKFYDHFVYTPSTNTYDSIDEVGMDNIGPLFAYRLITALYANVVKYIETDWSLNSYLMSLNSYLVRWVNKDLRNNNSLNSKMSIAMYLLNDIWDDVRDFSISSINANNIESNPFVNKELSDFTNDFSKFIINDDE